MMTAILLGNYRSQLYRPSCKQVNNRSNPLIWQFQKHEYTLIPDDQAAIQKKLKLIYKYLLT